MEVWMFILGLIIGALICTIIAWGTVKKYHKTAQLYFDMYTEAADTIKDLVVSDWDFGNLDDLR